MDLLDAMLEKNVRCVDYERMCDANGQRVVAFGKYAGIAGMIDILHGLGLRYIFGKYACIAGMIDILHGLGLRYSIWQVCWHCWYD